MAFELQEYIPLEYDKLCLLIKDLYRHSKTWDFEELTSKMLYFDENLYLKMTIYKMLKDKKLVA